MQISSLFVFIFGILVACTGILTSLYCLFSSTVNAQKKWLAALVLAITVRASKPIAFYFDLSVGKLMSQLALSSGFLVGPLLYFYIASSLNRIEHFKLGWKLHLFTILIAVVSFGIAYPYYQHPSLWGGAIYSLTNWLFAFYIALSAFLLMPQAIVWVGDNSHLSCNDKLAVKFVFAAILLWLSYVTTSLVVALSFIFIVFSFRALRRLEEEDAKVDQF